MQSAYYQIDVLSDIHEELHRIGESEFFYLIQGRAVISFKDQQKLLKEEDVFYINAGEMSRVFAGPDSLVLRIKIPGSRLLQAGGSEFENIECDSTLGRGAYYGRIRNLAHNVLSAWLEPSNGLLLSGAEDLLCDCLVRYFSSKKESGASKGGEGSDEQRMGKIMRYIYAHLDSDISLTDISKELYMSPSALSRYFHKITGKSFVKYVKEIRIQRAMSDLQQTDHSISQIALDNGFSTPSALGSAFREYVHMTASEYRQSSAAKQEKEELDARKTEVRKKLDLRMFEDAESESIQLVVDPDESTPLKKWKNEIVTGGAAYNLSNAAMQAQLLFLKEQLDYEYLLIWSLFSEPMQIFYGEDRSNPNYARIDEVLDFCVNNNIKVFLDLSQRRNKAIARGEREIYDQCVGVDFRSREEWENFFSGFLKHISRRYGETTVRSWVFEFTFFLNERPYYESDHYSPREVWNRGVSLLHEIIPGARTAGPGMILAGDSELQKQVIDQFMAYGNPPDIFTVNYFLMNSTEEMGIYRRNMRNNYPEKELESVAMRLRHWNFHGKYYCPEFALTIANRDFIQDSCYRATSLIWSIFRIWSMTDKLGIFYASDLLNSYADSSDILAGAGGILTRDGIAKPAMYAFQFLKDMGDRLLVKREDLMITRSEQVIQCLAVNHCEMDPEYAETRTMRKPEEISRIFLPGKDKKYHLVVKTSENATFLIRQKIVNTSFGSILDSWNEMGNISDLNPEDITYLRNTCVPKIRISKIPAVEQKIELDLTLKPHEIRWVSIERTEM